MWPLTVYMTLKTMGYLVTDEVIQTVGHGIENEWKTVAKNLKISRSEIRQIEKDAADNKQAAMMMLQKWKAKDGTGDEHKLFLLRKAMVQINRQDLLSYLGNYEMGMLSLT